MARDLEVSVGITAQDDASRVLAAFGENLGKIGDNTSTLAGALRRIGVELEENVEKKVEANNKILAAAAKAFQDGRISAEDFARAQTKIGEVNERLRSSLSGVSTQVAEQGGTFSRLGSFLRDSFVITLGDVVNGFRKAGEIVKGFIDAASEQEDAVKQLDNALSSLGVGAGKVSLALQEQAGSLQKVTRFGDEAIERGQAFLATFVKQEDVLKRSTQAAVDLAAALGIDLQTSFELLAKAAQGNTASLSRYGIVLDDSLPVGQKFDALLKQIATTMGGRAQKDAETFSGALAQVKNALNDLEEAAGAAITSNTSVVKSLKDMRDVASDPKTVEGVGVLARGFAGIYSGIAAGLIEKLGEAGVAIRTLSEKAQDAGIGIGNFFVPEIVKGRDETERWYTTLLEADVPFRVVVNATNDSTEALRRNEDLLRRNVRVYADLKDAQGDVATSASKLGVVLETNVLNAINENNQAYDKLVEKLRTTGGTAGDFARAQEALRVANQALLDSLNPIAASAAATSDANVSAAASARDHAEALGELSNALILTGDGFANYLVRLNQVKAAAAALTAEFQTDAQKITGATDAMLGPLDQPGDPLPSNLGRSGGGGAQAILTYGQAYSQQVGGLVRTTKIANTASGGNVARTYTVFGVLPNGKVYPLGTQVIGPDGTILSGQQFG